MEIQLCPMPILVTPVPIMLLGPTDPRTEGQRGFRAIALRLRLWVLGHCVVSTDFKPDLGPSQCELPWGQIFFICSKYFLF